MSSSCGGAGRGHRLCCISRKCPDDSSTDDASVGLPSFGRLCCITLFGLCTSLDELSNVLSLFSSNLPARCCRSAVFSSRPSTDDLKGDKPFLVFDIGEAGEAPLLAAFLFNLGEEVGCGEGLRSCSGGVESLGVELLGGEGDNHQNSFALPLSK